MKAEDYFERGNAKLHKGDLDGALADYDKAIELNPDYVVAYNNRGFTKSKKGDLDGALADCDKAIELNPDYAVAYNNRGIAKWHKGDLVGALADYDKAIELNPDHAGAYNNRGFTKSNKGDLDGALADYDKAIELNPDHAGAYNNRGFTKSNKGDLDGALADCDKAIELDPDYARAYNNRGIAKLHKGDLAGALADYDKAIELKPRFAEAYINRGFTKSNKGDLAGALADYDKAIELNPDHAGAYNNRGIAKWHKGDQDGAITDFDKVIELEPRFVEAYINRGNAKSDKDDQDGALADYDKAIELKPDYALAYSNRGNAKRRKSDLEGAIADCDKAIELKPRYAHAYYNRGKAKSDKGDQDGAIADYDKANEFDPGLSNLELDLRIAKVTVELEYLDERKLVDQLQQQIDKLLNAISKKSITEAEPMHYTNLNTLKSLVKGEKFRLFNSSNMTDRSEGQVFFELLSLDEMDKKNIRQKYGGINASDVYLGSFVTDSQTEVGDNMMWRTYGKHEGKEYAGCALVFKKNNFAEKWTARKFLSPLLQDAGSALKVKPVSRKELFLFPVIYIDPETKTTEIKSIDKELADLGTTLSKLQNIKSEDTIKLISDMLGIVRFLFKHIEYRREQEARLIIWRDDSTGKVVKQEPPGKKYIECMQRLKPYRVIFGQDVSEVEDWVSWIKTKSKYKIDTRVN